MKRKSTYKEFIPLALYRKIVELMPIPCVDVVFKAGSKVFLFMRAYEPAKGKWWLVGGRILRNETFEQAVIRKMKEEIGVDAKVGRMIGTYEEFFANSRFDNESGKTGNGKTGTHTLSICFVAEPKNRNFKLRLNDEYDGYRTIDRIEENLEPYIKNVLKDSGVFK